ncbi:MULTISPECIES: hypothetical protein [unclassified Streptomyces]|uniref:hypothetical protein n=1 Tax=unclassified Streptomyces TaxID=2593676 RepID=UPI002E0EE00B|nr:hypothetical protein OG452_24525 [Streptomyces sp. NBC_01197]WSS49076.1 hypothetical protein OG708_10705 [Streptomyces sp. NBC_01180]
MNDIYAMRNINRNLFAGVPVTANALEEYDPDAARLVREAAQHLVRARRDNDPQALDEASNATFQAAAELLNQAGRSVYVRFPIMLAARLVELEAALFVAKDASEAEGEAA